MLQNTPNRWLVGAGSEKAAMRLFVFPYAGGGASAFRQWNKALAPRVASYTIQLPGRETRFTEPKLTRFSAAIEAIGDALRPNLDHPFAFFGHSLGGLLAFETARHLRRLNAPTPLHLFVSGCSAPQLREPEEQYNKLSDAGFVQAVRKFGGIPDEILQNTELLDLFLPTLRADFRLLETYDYVQETALDCPITAFGGLEDAETPESKLAAWNVHTTRAFRLSMFSGDHFFLHPARDLLLAEITRDLEGFLEL
jgi:surfactin synthase thioesterase subunit